MERQPAKECIKRNLKTLRNRKGLNQRELGAELGISQPRYQHYEGGDNDPPYDVLIKIVDLYQADLYKFLTEIL